MTDTHSHWRRPMEWVWGPPKFENDNDTRRVTFFALVIITVGVVVLFAYAGFSKTTASWMLGAAAFFAVGITTGFIFAIPRASQQYVNSNLELISDWLTKILVGVGLTQMREIPVGLRTLTTFIAGGAECSSSRDRAFALFVILYFSFGGFVSGYLETRVYLTGAFFRSEGKNDDQGHRAGRSDGSGQNANPQ